MPFNGSGTWSRLYSWVADAAANIDITASRMDADANDMASNGFDNCLTRDGQGQPNTTIPWNGQGINNIATITFAAGGSMAVASGSYTITGVTLNGTTVLSGPITATGQTITGGTFAGPALSGPTLSGTVTGGTFSGGTWNGNAVGVGYGGTGLAAGTSGGVLAFTATGVLASSAALTLNKPVIGGGAGAAPTVGATSGNTTTFATSSGALTSTHGVKIDASGNFIDSGAAWAQPFTKVSTSSGQAIPAAGSLLTVAHSLGSQPTVVSMKLTCVTGDNGYTAGQVVDCGTTFAVVAGANNGLQCFTDTSNVYVVQGSGGVLTILGPGGGNGTLTQANWNILIVAWI
jgi:hypothetical protein